MNIKAGDTVKVKREIKRIDHKNRDAGFQVYAKAGDTGKVEEVFKGQTPSGNDDQYFWYAKVRMGTELKTFRLTSIEVAKG